MLANFDGSLVLLLATVLFNNITFLYAADGINNELCILNYSCMYRKIYLSNGLPPCRCWSRCWPQLHLGHYWWEEYHAGLWDAYGVGHITYFTKYLASDHVI